MIIINIIVVIIMIAVTMMMTMMMKLLVVIVRMRPIFQMYIAILFFCLYPPGGLFWNSY